MTHGWQTQARSTRDKRRKKHQRAPRPLSETVKPAAQERAEAPRSAAPSSGWRQAPARTSASLSIRAEDYGYVYSDLKRIAILSSAIFAVLIALTFVIK